MGKKPPQISYILESAKASAGGHRLGVSGLTVDTNNSILYSGGRDGIVCAWDLNLDLSGRGSEQAKTTFRSQTQAHVQWINDITLAHQNQALVSASSDGTVKVWRPAADDNIGPQTIGTHTDYVKCVAAPPTQIGANWVAAAGLDRKVCLWDLNGAGKSVEIDVVPDEGKDKGSIYALTVGHNLMACGGPEKAVRLYDPRTGNKVSKLLGHLDTIRSILIDAEGDTILSASSDKTIKMWSVRGGRCIYTFTTHEDSVWSLHSDDPRLGTFYSGDRSGLVVKTDVRGSMDDLDEGLSLAMVQEHSGVQKVVAAGGHIWTATNQSSINRWQDIDTGALQLPEAFSNSRPQSDAPKKEISANSILRISNTANFPSRQALGLESASTDEGRRMSQAPQPDLEVKPLYHVPEETIEGQFGLLKHKLLNDRRRVLTVDTAGDVLMWDLIQCKTIQSFGKRSLEDVEREVNTKEAVAPWCGVDVSSGNLTVTLQPYNCFDAELYADELKLDEPVEFREDQRISLGRWVLRYLFANLIDEEIKRDEAHRQQLNEEVTKRVKARPNAPISIEIPEQDTSGWAESATPRANGQYPPTTAGMAIGLATPAAGAPPVLEVKGSPISKDRTPANPPSVEKEDYFTTPISPSESAPKSAGPAPEADKKDDDKKEKEKDKDEAKSPTVFGKKFRMSFGGKKLGRSGSQATTEKPTVIEEKAEESESSSNHEKEVEDSFFGVVQKIRNEYEKQLADSPNKHVETKLTPSLPSDTPVLKLPPATKVIIQELTNASAASLYQGTVESVGRDADIIEQKAPMWLGDVLLQNQVPFKEPVKVSFVLHPLGDLPTISTADGNNRLNANRMLRVKKILSYVSERIEAPEEPDPNALRPDEYLELYCNEQVLDPAMTLATLRTHVWKGGSDIVLHYKANGRKVIRPQAPPPAPEPEPETAASETTTAVDGTNAGTPATPQPRPEKIPVSN